MKKAAVIVAGSWGTALASVLADKGIEVALWSRNEAQVREINTYHSNEKYVPGITLSPLIRATTNMAEALAEAEAVVLVAPSKAMREIAGLAAPFIRRDMLLIHATKGFEAGTNKRMSVVVAEETGISTDQVVVLSGPSHAEEVIRRSPTTVVVASQDLSRSEAAQDLFISPCFRVYTNPDIVGVELAGALKNIIAIGAGLSDGLGYGDNAKAALLTRGLAEIARLATSLGANPLTFAGLAGVGDLVVTCTSRHSRNWRAGYRIAEGVPLDDVLREMGMVVEGVRSTKTAYELAQQSRIEMPITEALYHVLFYGENPRQAVESLMTRGKTHEIEEIAQASKEKWFYG
jgi:glycerol-3-phosphate dehydrogenase (NAD(P)+)